MKFTTLSSIFLASLFSSFSAFAGPGEGGGGNILYPSALEVKQAIKNIWEGPSQEQDLFNALQALNIGDRIKDVSDPRAKKILSVFYDPAKNFENGGNTYPIYKAMQKTKYEIKTDGACKHGTKSTAASVVYNRLGDIADAKFHEVHKHKGEALICYSVSELKKVPKGSLNHQLIALTLHEFAHLFGFGELDAQSLQRFLLVYGNTFLNTDFVGLDNLDPRWVEETLVDLETHTAANKSDATLCVWSTMMLKATMEYRENVWAATFESPGRIRIVNSIAGPQSNYIVLLTGSLMQYCPDAPRYFGLSTHEGWKMPKPVSVGNVSDFRTRLVEIRAEFEKLKALISE